MEIDRAITSYAKDSLSGYCNAVIPCDSVPLRPSLLAPFLRLLQGMGESNAALNRRDRVSREALLGAAAAYQGKKLVDYIRETRQAASRVVVMISCKTHQVRFTCW